MVTFVEEATVSVVTINVAVDEPAETVTEAGTVATEVLELVSVTSAPPAAALPVSVTVPVDELLPTTAVGESVREESAAGVTVSVAVLVTPAATPVMVAEVEDATPSVVTVNVAVLALAATVTLAGTVAAAVLELESVTARPPVAAFPVSVTVAVEGLPPTTLAGTSVTLVKAAGVTVSVAVLVTPE